MDSLKIDSGAVNLPIIRDGEETGTISFNPYDLAWVEKFEDLRPSVEKKLEEMSQEETDLDKVIETAEGQALIDTQRKRKELRREAFSYFYELIDSMFGEGTSKVAFGETMNVMAIYSFIDGVTGYMKPLRNEKMAPYLAAGKRRGKK